MDDDQVVCDMDKLLCALENGRETTVTDVPAIPLFTPPAEGSKLLTVKLQLLLLLLFNPLLPSCISPALVHRTPHSAPSTLKKSEWW